MWSCARSEEVRGRTTGEGVQGEGKLQRRQAEDERHEEEEMRSGKKNVAKEIVMRGRGGSRGEPIMRLISRPSCQTWNRCSPTVVEESMRSKEDSSRSLSKGVTWSRQRRERVTRVPLERGKVRYCRAREANVSEFGTTGRARNQRRVRTE